MKIRQRILEMLQNRWRGEFLCSCADALRWQSSSCFKAQCHGGEQMTRSSVTPILQAFQLHSYTRAIIFPIISSAYVYHHNYIKKRLHTRTIKTFNTIFFHATVTNIEYSLQHHCLQYPQSIKEIRK